MIIANLDVPTEGFRLYKPFKEIKLKHSSGLVFNLELRMGITFVYGDSAVGKSLFYSTLQDYKLYNKLSSNTDNTLDRVVLFNYSHMLPLIDSLKLLKGNLIVLDNFDYLRREDSNIVDYINTDFDNQYLLFGRRLNGLLLETNCVAKMIKTDNIVSLQYVI